MAINESYRLYALSLPALLLCACAATPQIPDCPKPIPPNPDLMQQLPPPGWFSQQLETILRQGMTSGRHSAPSPGGQTKSLPKPADSSAPPDDLF